MDPAHEIAGIFKGILVLVFAGMSILFWFVNRNDDRRRMKEVRQVEMENAALPINEEDLTPLEKLRLGFSRLFKLSDSPLQRGKLLEDVCNQLFVLGDVSVGCPFERRRDENGKPTQHVDGVIELDDNLYLVEMRWEETPFGISDFEKHVEMITAGEDGTATRGVIISFSGFTEKAVEAARQAISAGNLVVLCTVTDFAQVVEGEGHVDALLRTRIHIASHEKNPYASYA